MGISQENSSLEHQPSEPNSQPLEVDRQDTQVIDSLCSLLSELEPQGEESAVMTSIPEEVISTPKVEDLSTLSELLSIPSENSSSQVEVSSPSLEGQEDMEMPEHRDRKTRGQGERAESANLSQPFSEDSSSPFSQDSQTQLSSSTSSQIFSQSSLRSQQFQYLLREYAKRKQQSNQGEIPPSSKSLFQKTSIPETIQSEGQPLEESKTIQTGQEKSSFSETIQSEGQPLEESKTIQTGQEKSSFPETIQSEGQPLEESKTIQHRTPVEEDYPLTSNFSVDEENIPTPEPSPQSQQVETPITPQAEVSPLGQVSQNLRVRDSSQETRQTEVQNQVKPVAENIPKSLNLDTEDIDFKVNQDASQDSPSSSSQESSESVNLNLNNLPKLIRDISTKQESVVLDQSELTDLYQIVNRLETRLEELANQVYKPTDLIDPLLPLIAELIQDRERESKSVILSAIVPVIDEVIQQRTAQNSDAMSAAIAKILPGAITKEIQDSPQEIARAIAPEIATAIKEQTRLERNSISEALGPEMGKAIKTQIEVERDAMVDALYPVIGNTISKYMGEAIQSINQKVESALTPEGIQRKIRAKLQGVSEAELILKESMPFTTQAIFLIHKMSGLVIREIQPALKQPLEPNMMAGMLTAIRSFVNDCIAQPGEVLEIDEIDYGDSQIVLEVAGYCYLAVVIKGEPSKAYRTNMRQIFGQLVQQYDQQIQEFEGEQDTIPETVTILLQQLIEIEEAEKASTPPFTLLLILAIVLAAFAIPWGIYLYRNAEDTRDSRLIATQLEEIQPLSYTPVIPIVNRNRLTLTGRVPTAELKAKVIELVEQSGKEWEIDNQIVVIKVPPDPNLIAAAADLMTEQLNQDAGINMVSTYDQGTVILRGTLTNITQAQSFPDIYQRIPGVQNVDLVGLQPEAIQKRVYFQPGVTQVPTETFGTILLPIKEFLKQNQVVHLKIIGHADPLGESDTNKQLATLRATVVKQLLQSSKIDPARLQIFGRTTPPPDVTPDQPYELSRCVRFEVVIPGEKQKL